MIAATELWKRPESHFPELKKCKSRVILIALTLKRIGGVRMTDSELHSLFAKRFPKIRSHLTYYSKGIEDRRQDGLLGMWEFLKKDPNCTDRYLKNGVIWRITNGARNKSVDVPWGLTDLERLPFELLSKDAPESVVAEFLVHKSLPIDEIVSDKISYERFLSRLSSKEKKFVQARLSGLQNKEIHAKLKIEANGLRLIRNSALSKFRQAFGSPQVCN